MEFPFYISQILKPDENGFSVITSKVAEQMRLEQQIYDQKYKKYPQDRTAVSNKIGAIIDKMGKLSAKA